MTTKLTAEVAWNNLPGCLSTTAVYEDLGENDQKRLGQWFVFVRSSIAAEKDAEIAELKRQLDHWINLSAKYRDEREAAQNAASKKDAEIVRLQAELDRLRPKPKPRQTAGEKLRDTLCEEYLKNGDAISPWSQCWDTTKAAYESAAKRLGLTDDPEPPSDGELLKRVMQGTVGIVTIYWDNQAAEFLRLRAERDGGAM